MQTYLNFICHRGPLIIYCKKWVSACDSDNLANMHINAPSCINSAYLLNCLSHFYPFSIKSVAQSEILYYYHHQSACKWKVRLWPENSCAIKIVWFLVKKRWKVVKFQNVALWTATLCQFHRLSNNVELKMCS